MMTLKRAEAEKLMQLAVAAAVDHSAVFDAEEDEVILSGKKALKSLLRIIRNDDADIVPASTRAECAAKLRELADKVEAEELAAVEASWTFGGMLVTKAIGH